jgi:imidazolonepropionase-like amidohydrolase
LIGLVLSSLILFTIFDCVDVGLLNERSHYLYSMANGRSKSHLETIPEINHIFFNMRLGQGLSLLLVLAFFATLRCHASGLALVGAKIYLSPSDPPIENGTILIHNGHILSVGPVEEIKVPRGMTIIDCKGLVVTAGFWNSHVHILLPGLLHAEKLSPGQITLQIQQMLTQWGFTTVFDIASVLQNTNLIRRRIAGGEVKGPRILTTGEPFWVKGGTPVYVKAFLEANQISIPEVESNAQAEERVRQQIHDGVDGIKIFANSIEQNEILTMPSDLARVIATGTHRAGKPVFAHVSNNQGIEIAIQSGVDILAHTTPFHDAWSPSLVQRLTAAHMAITPTLTLWDVESQKANASADNIEKVMNRAAGQLEAFSLAGGQVLFGTDVGYIQQFDTSEEFTWMSRAGMSFREILASLTTNPAQRFGYASHSGRIAKGLDADLVVLDADPSQQISAFSKVRYTIRDGKIIYAEK